MSLTAQEWRQLSGLLDQALELSPQERRQWFESLSLANDRLKQALGRLLDQWDTEGGDAVSRLLNTGQGLPPPADVTTHSAPGERLLGLHAGTEIGPYRLLRPLGRGGMSTVWEAVRADGSIKRSVALKLPFTALSGMVLRDRFERERDILSLLSHPHIASLYDAGITDSGQPFLALAYVQGEPITDYCRARSLDLRSRLRLFMQVLQALQYAHSRLVVHRDLKPSNILVTPQGEARLLDFGIGKLLHEGLVGADLTQAGENPLTPRYASPEQIGGGDVTTATDIYSLGTLLHELLTGELPYRVERATRAAWEEAVLSAPPIPPSRTRVAWARALRGDLDAIVLKAIARSPALRYASADAFAQDIERHLAGHPVQARPESAWYALSRFLWRHRRLATAAAVTGVALAGTAGVALMQAIKAERHAQTARAAQAFLENIFLANASNQPNPLKARNTPARELLDQGARRIDTDLKDAPAARLEIMKSLCDMYADLGLAQESLVLARKRVALAATLDSPAVQAHLDVARAASTLGLRDESRQALEAAQAVLDGALQGDPAARVRLEIEWSRHQRFFTMDLQQPLVHLSNAASILQVRPPSAELVRVKASTGSLYNAMNRYADAERELGQALALEKQLDGQARSLLPGIHTGLGVAQFGLGRLAQAERSYRDALASAQSLYGADSSPGVDAAIGLGVFLRRTGRVGESLPLLKAASVAASQRAAQSPDEAATADLQYARSLTTYGALDEAFEVASRAVDLNRRVGVEPGLRTAMLEGLAEAAIEQGRYAMAQSLLEEVQGIQRQGDAAKADVSIKSLSVFRRARLLMLMGRWQEAGEVAKEFPPGPLQSPLYFDEAARQVFMAELSLAGGDAAMALRHADDAAARLEEDGSRAMLKTKARNIALVQGRAYLRLGLQDRALAALIRAVALSSELFGPDSPALADARVALAECLLRLGDRMQATALMQQASLTHGRHAMVAEHYRRPLQELRQHLGLAVRSPVPSRS